MQQSHTLTHTVITNSACMNHYQKIMSSHGFSPHGWAHPFGLIRCCPSVLFCFFSGFSKWDFTLPSSSVVASIVVFCGGAGVDGFLLFPCFPIAPQLSELVCLLCLFFFPHAPLLIMESVWCFLWAFFGPTPACSIADGLIL